MIEARATTALEHDLRPNPAVLCGAGGAVALISALSLPWPLAIASVALAALMIAGAEIDARTYLIPDTVSCGSILAGILAAPLLASVEPWLAMATAIERAAGTAAALAAVRWCYGLLRGREGVGFGDIKLAAAVGAWLPLVDIPPCFGIATGSALLTVVLARLRGQGIDATMKLPFGAFLCPALWLVFYAGALAG